MISVDCGNLTDPENGMVRVSGTLEGDTAEYSCIEGYELSENCTRICGPNETWSGEEPTCISKPRPTKYKALCCRCQWDISMIGFCVAS